MTARLVEEYKTGVRDILERKKGKKEAWVCRRSLAGIEGSNPPGGIDVSLF
jgi:hypothetical protein